jgi:hypothetical protein
MIVVYILLVINGICALGAWFIAIFGKRICIEYDMDTEFFKQIRKKGCKKRKTRRFRRVGKYEKVNPSKTDSGLTAPCMQTKRTA